MKEMQVKGEDVSKLLGYAYQQLGIKSEASFDKQKQAALTAFKLIESSGNATWKDLQNGHAAMTAKISALDKASNFQTANQGAKSLTKNIDGVGASVDTLTNRFTALMSGVAAWYVGGKLWQGFQAGVQAVDDFQMSVVQMAATITSLQGGNDIATNYKAAKEYAEGLQATLMKVDANTSLNLTNLQTITFEMTKQGVLLDTTNGKQVEAFTRLANAVAVYSRNGRDEMQVRQEVAALLRGEVDQNSQLASMIQKTVDGPLKEQVDKWKQSGTLLEELGNRLKGFGEGSKDISTMWSSVKSSFQTAVTAILQAGFPTIVKDISGWLDKINNYLKEHKDVIAGDIKEGWTTLKSYMSTAADIAKALYNNFEPFVAFFVGGLLLKGIGSAVAMMKTMLEVATATRAVMLATGMITAGTGVAAAAGTGAAVAGGAAAGGGIMAAIGGGLLSTAGALTAGVGVGYAAQPLVRWADKKLYQSTGLNLTGEAMYNEAQAREADSIKNYNAMLAKKGEGAASGKAPPKIDVKDTQEQIKKKIEDQEKELAAFKASQDKKTNYAKHMAEVELADLKQFYAEGRITTQEYYEEEARIALAAAETKYDNDVDYYNKEVDLLNFVLAKKGANSREYSEELARNTKADEAVLLSKLDLQKTRITEETKFQDAVRSSAAAYSKLQAQSLEEAGQYVQAAETKIAAERKTVEYRRMSSAELALKEREFSIQRTEASIRELNEARQFTSEVRALQDELDAVLGKNRAISQAESDMRAGREKLEDIERRLLLATEKNATTAIASLTRQYELQTALNKEKAKTLQFEQDLGVLTGDIVGFSNGTPIYAKDYAAGQYNYQSAAAAAASRFTGGTASISGNSPFVSLGDAYWGSTPKLATGTNLIPADGYYYLHKKEAVVPEKYNPAAGGTGTAGITVQGNIQFVLPNVTDRNTADDLARQVIPKLQEYMKTRLRA
jgi:hypothetical protein